MRDPDLIKISEMAALHGVSRQTLILYDKNGLLKPAYVSENGYRYYSVSQIPRLRQICLLKEMGVPLARIREHLEEHSIESMGRLLDERTAQIDEELERLRRQREELEQLGEVFDVAARRVDESNEPHIHHETQRKVLYAPYPTGEMDPKLLHLTLMDAWGCLLEAGMLPSRGFGSLLDAQAVRGESPLAGAGSIVIMPREAPVEGCEVITLPEGDYVCMYKYAMPYDVEPVRWLLAWMDERGLRPAGPVVDCCLLDSVFYGDAHFADFCRLEILLA